MVKMKFTDTQTAFDYALYMIATSYFDKAECKNTIKEKNMYIQYKEQKLDNQYKMEDICIDYMERLLKKLPEEVFKQNIKAYLRKLDDKHTEILLVGKAYALSLIGTYAGRNTVIDSRIFKKEAAL